MSYSHMNRPPGGIYLLKNTVTGRIYVGQSLAPDARRLEHYAAMRNKRHPSPVMQADFDGYGEESFAWLSAGAPRIPHVLRKLEAKAIVYLDQFHELYNRVKPYSRDLIDSLFVEFAGCLFTIQQANYQPAFVTKTVVLGNG